MFGFLRKIGLGHLKDALFEDFQRISAGRAHQ